MADTKTISIELNQHQQITYKTGLFDTIIDSERTLNLLLIDLCSVLHNFNIKFAPNKLAPFKFGLHVTKL